MKRHNKGVDKGSSSSHLNIVPHQSPSDNGGSISSKCEPEEPEDEVLLFSSYWSVSVARYSIAKQPESKGARKYVYVFSKNNSSSFLSLTEGYFHIQKSGFHEKHENGAEYHPGSTCIIISIRVRVTIAKRVFSRKALGDIRGAVIRIVETLS
jgi:hypothetical protein